MSQIICPHCRRPLELDGMGLKPGDQLACPACRGQFFMPGSARQPDPFAAPLMRSNTDFSPPVNVTRRYPILRSIALGFRLMGILSLVLGVVCVILALSHYAVSSDGQMSPLELVTGSAVVLAIAVSIALFYFAIAELFFVFLDIEENTRRSSLVLNKLANDRRSPLAN